jgi:hypothetical protein
MLGWLALVATPLMSASNAHVLDVSYRNQLDGSAYALANCGPTSLSMVLAYYGIDDSVWDLRARSMQAQHSLWATRAATRLDTVCSSTTWRASQRASESTPMVCGRGTPTAPTIFWSGRHYSFGVRLRLIVQASYRALPTHADSRTLDDHYSVVHGTVGTDFVYSHPMGIRDSGPVQQISESDLMAAMAAAASPRAGFAVVRPRA